ncbi:MAG: hypothetical protein Q9160_007006 [Pyrenula sp. 1 TL-2023]
MSPASGAAQIPRLLKGEKSVPTDSDIGSKDYSQTPIAVLLGGAFDDAGTAQMMKATAAVEGAKRVPWLRPDMTKPHPPLGPEYGPAMGLRIKERLEQLRGRGEMDEEKAGWVGKGKDNTKSPQDEHIARPLASLKDPDSFGPPPKNVNYHGGAAVPDHTTPDRRGLGAPLSQNQIQSQKQAEKARAQEEQEEAQKPAPPPGPYKMNTTGLSTKNLLPPPVHHAISEDASTQDSPAAPQKKPKPSLPPRLPPRKTHSTDSPLTPPPPSYDSATSQTQPVAGSVNRGALDRLGSAGVSVSGLGIGQQSNPWKNERSQSTTSNASGKGQLSELQSRFSKMNTKSRPSPTNDGTSPAPPPQGTTLAEKQAAFNTAQSFHKDPNSVSLSDARAAASTANNFRERHGEEVSAGAQKANTWNKKYNVTGRMNSFLEKQASPANETQPTAQSESISSQADAYGRKPPPPPVPNKRPDMHAGAQSPPPVPLGTKPR